MKGSELFSKEKEVEIRGVNVKVRELEIDDISYIMDNLLELLQKLPSTFWDDKNMDPMVIIKTIMQDKSFWTSFKRILARVCDLEYEVVSKASILVLAKLVKAFFEVNSISEIKEIFLELKGTLLTGESQIGLRQED